MPCKVHCHEQMFELDMLFTHRGLSGPAMLQISSYWKSGEALLIDLDPQDEWTHHFIEQKRQEPRARLRQCFSEALPKRLVSTLFAEDLFKY